MVPQNVLRLSAPPPDYYFSQNNVELFWNSLALFRGVKIVIKNYQDNGWEARRSRNFIIRASYNDENDFGILIDNEWYDGTRRRKL